MNDLIYVAKNGKTWQSCGYNFPNLDEALQYAASKLQPREQLVYAQAIVSPNVKFGNMFVVQYEFPCVVNQTTKQKNNNEDKS